MGRLDGKVAIVTGAGSGFGEAIAHGFVSEGAHVLVADIAVANGERVVDEIGKRQYTGGGSAVFVEVNVAQRGDWEKALELAKSKFGKLDIVVNNAGTTYRKKPSVEVTDAEFDKIIAVNVKSIYLSVSVVMPYFVERKSGVYLNTSSVAGTRVRPGQVFYGGTKGFLNTVCVQQPNPSLGAYMLVYVLCELTHRFRSLRVWRPNMDRMESVSIPYVPFEERPASWKCSAVFLTRPKREPSLRSACP